MDQVPPLAQGPLSADFLEKLRVYGGTDEFVARLSADPPTVRSSDDLPDDVPGSIRRIPVPDAARKGRYVRRRYPRGLGDGLIMLSGADVALLADFPSERPKYVGLGGMIFTTGVMAGLSAVVAIKIALDAPTGVCLAIGALWALAVINLDRWITVSVQWQGAWHRKILVALPRLALGVILSIVVVEPLQLQIFEPEINAQLVVNHQMQVAAFEKSLASDPRVTRIAILRSDATRSQTVIDQGGPEAEIAKAARNSDLAKIDSLERSVQLGRAAATAQIMNDDGLLARLQALSTLTSEHRSIATAMWLLRLLFVAIELLPVLVGLLQALGRPTLYDRLRVVKEHYVIAEEELQISRREQLVEIAQREDAADTIREIEEFLSRQIEARLSQAKDEVYSDVLMRRQLTRARVV